MRSLPVVTALAGLLLCAFGSAQESPRTLLYVSDCTPPHQIPPLLEAVSGRLAEISWSLRHLTDIPCPVSDAVPWAERLLDAQHAEAVYWQDGEERGVLHFFAAGAEPTPIFTRDTGDPADPVWPDTTAMIVHGTLKALQDEGLEKAGENAATGPATPIPDDTEPPSRSHPGTGKSGTSPAGGADGRPPQKSSAFTGLVAEFTYQPLMIGSIGVKSVSMSHGFGITLGVTLFDRLQPFVGFIPAVPVKSKTLYNHYGILYADLVRRPIWLGIGGTFGKRRVRVVPVASVTIDVATIDIEHPGFEPGTEPEVQLRSARIALTDPREVTYINQCFLSLPLFISVYFRILPGWWALASAGVDVLLTDTHLLTAYVDGNEVGRLSLWPIRPFLQIGFSFTFLSDR